MSFAAVLCVGLHQCRSGSVVCFLYSCCFSSISACELSKNRFAVQSTWGCVEFSCVKILHYAECDPWQWARKLPFRTNVDGWRPAGKFKHTHTQLHTNTQEIILSPGWLKFNKPPKTQILIFKHTCVCLVLAWVCACVSICLLAYSRPQESVGTITVEPPEGD